MMSHQSSRSASAGSAPTKRKIVQGTDAPAGHRCYKLVKSFAQGSGFFLKDVWADAGREQDLARETAACGKKPKVAIRVTEVLNNQVAAARLARLCFVRAEKAKTLEEIHDYQKAICEKWRRSNSGPPLKRARRHAASPLLELSTLPVRETRHKVGPMPPAAALQNFYGMVNARETVAQRRKSGCAAARIYEGLQSKYADIFQRRRCPNVRRREDRTTRALHAFAAAAERRVCLVFPRDVDHLKRLCVLNFAVWRYIGGTIEFARAVGFLTAWTDATKERIRNIVRTAYHDGRAQSLFSDAYSSCRLLRHAFGTKCTPAKLKCLLYNKGPNAVPNNQRAFVFNTLHGKLLLMDSLWELAPDVVAAAEPRKDGISWQRVANVLGRVPYFGRNEKSHRVPTFFAKEIAQDLLDTPVFEGGRAAVSDLRSFSPAGPGALEGLKLMYGLSKEPSQKEAIPLMRAVLEAATSHWQHGDPAGLELHDIQFMLCEYQKFFKPGGTRARAYRGSPRPIFVEKGLQAPMPQLVEEALMLGLAEQFLRGRKEVDYLSEDDLFDYFARWQSLDDDNLLYDWIEGCEVGEGLVLDGHQVQLRPWRGPSQLGRGLTINMRNAGSVLSEAAQTQCATLFVVERHSDRPAFALEYGEKLWLRAPNGAHLGPDKGSSSSRKARAEPFLSASPTSPRYDDSRLFVVWPSPYNRDPKRKRGTGDAVQSGDHVVLRLASSPELAVVTPTREPQICELQQWRDNPSWRPEISEDVLVVDRHPAFVQARAHFFRQFYASLDECVARGRMRRKEASATRWYGIPDVMPMRKRVEIARILATGNQL